MDKTCYWIAKPGHMYRRDCDHQVAYLYKSMMKPETESLEPYIGTKCPNCGGIVTIDEHSYDLVKES